MFRLIPVGEKEIFDNRNSLPNDVLDVVVMRFMPSF
jgi:hypothetical protein